MGGPVQHGLPDVCQNSEFRCSSRPIGEIIVRGIPIIGVTADELGEEFGVVCTDPIAIRLISGIIPYSYLKIVRGTSGFPQTLRREGVALSRTCSPYPDRTHPSRVECTPGGQSPPLGCIWSIRSRFTYHVAVISESAPLT
ncbi:hypothetical protein PAAG_03474 [Paracoccidioides lutzii Pb01]|uniref:Uncharacterized protein n=1 Tax=Paracoccidioides lutzii (strain ATCC MYA-826 / Pb01) TaxID=502779 RepID=C1GXA0_PARBA|nr:hypothetical protein PAAG_03474 [Paracoccidioides lutzii Pb01]EEH41188.1 hypothetical protein PAAG_03474 [Paracoccidioides lutzii Pb01]